jgi:2-haloacid dehalogenase
MTNVITPQWHFQHDLGVSFADMVAARSAEYPDAAHHIRHYAENFADSIPGPVPGSLELVERLDCAGVPLFGISNFGSDAWAQFRPRAPIFNRFRDIVISGHERLAKPDPAIFTLAVARFGVLPEQCLFVDDRADNVRAAQDCGMAGHVFADSKGLEAELVRLQLL